MQHRLDRCPQGRWELAQDAAAVPWNWFCAQHPTYAADYRRALRAAQRCRPDGAGDRGRRERLGMAMGASQAETFWVDFLRRLERRSLAGTKPVSWTGGLASVRVEDPATYGGCTPPPVSRSRRSP
jgi:hypothetical protein